MLIHTVVQGDTVFSIARKYSVSPIKIIENNGLIYPDHLIPGQKLLILTPTRTYIVRGGDTVSKICRRFGIKKNTLLSNNPSLHGRQQLHAGTELVIHYDAPLYSAAALNGYVYNCTSADRFYTLLPYLTYVTFSSVEKSMHQWIEEASKEGKIPLLRIHWKDLFFECGDKWENFEAKVTNAKELGFRGFALTSPYRGISCEDAGTFVFEIKKKLLGMDMLLFQELETEESAYYLDVADGIVALYEKCHKKEVPSFLEGEQKTLEAFAGKIEAGKAFLELSSFGYDSEKCLTMEQIFKIGIKYGAEIYNDEEKLVSYLDYTHYKNGEKKPLRIYFESLENIKAKLELMHELGFMGATVDVGRVPISYIMMLYNTFARVENPYTGFFGV